MGLKEGRTENKAGSEGCRRVPYDLSIALDQKWQKMQQNPQKASELQLAHWWVNAVLQIRSVVNMTQFSVHSRARNVIALTFGLRRGDK